MSSHYWDIHELREICDREGQITGYGAYPEVAPGVTCKLVGEFAQDVADAANMIERAREDRQGGKFRYDRRNGVL